MHYKCVGSPLHRNNQAFCGTLKANVAATSGTTEMWFIPWVAKNGLCHQPAFFQTNPSPPPLLIYWREKGNLVPAQSGVTGETLSRACEPFRSSVTCMPFWISLAAFCSGLTKNHFRSVAPSFRLKETVSSAPSPTEATCGASVELSETKREGLYTWQLCDIQQR